MRMERDPETILAAWLEEGPLRLPDTTRRAIAVNARTTNQTRLPWWLPQRRLVMNPVARFAMVAVAIAVLAGGALYVLSPGGVGGQPSAPPVATPSPSPTASPSAPPASPLASPSPVAFGSSNFKVPIEFTLADGWTVAADGDGVVALQLGDAAAAIMSLDSVTVRGATPTSPWVTWPDDIHAWLAGRPEFKPDGARTGVVGGQDAVIVDADYVREKITDPGDWLSPLPLASRQFSSCLSKSFTTWTTAKSRGER